MRTDLFRRPMAIPAPPTSKLISDKVTHGDAAGKVDTSSETSTGSDLAVALAAARAGADAAQAIAHRPEDLYFKGDSDPVTAADHRSEQAILEVLAEHCPQDPVVREEGGGTLPPNGRVWLVDPIDGTTNFIRGFPWAGVSVALWIDNAPAVGVVVDINTGDEYTATVGRGARMNGSPIRVSAVGDLGEALIVTGFPYNRAERAEICDTRFRRVLQEARGVRRLGAASLDLCMVACGKLDGYWEEDLSPWDMGAGVLMVTEAGGTVTDQHGRPVDATSQFVVAGNGRFHSRFLDTLNGRKPS